MSQVLEIPVTEAQALALRELEAAATAARERLALVFSFATAGHAPPGAQYAGVQQTPDGPRLLAQVADAS